MPLYFGLPLTIEEICRILKLNDKDIQYEDLDPYYLKYLAVNRYLDELSLDIRIRVWPTDKGQNVLGYQIEQTDDVWRRFCSADELIMLLIKLKTRFAVEITKLNADISEVRLEYMEGEPQTKYNPDPFVISW